MAGWVTARYFSNTDVFPFSCVRGCGARFRTAGTMNKHCSSYCTIPLKCSDCGKEFRLKSELKRHVKACVGTKEVEGGVGEVQMGGEVQGGGGDDEQMRGDLQGLAAMLSSSQQPSPYIAIKRCALTRLNVNTCRCFNCTGAVN